MKPDFSGEWILDRTASRLSPSAAGIVTARLQIEHYDPRIRCTGKFSSSDDAIEFTFDRLAGGSKVVKSENETSRCYWEQDALVTEDRIELADAAFVMTWRYELSGDARRLRCTERIRGGGRDQDNVWEFVRG